MFRKADKQSDQIAPSEQSVGINDLDVASSEDTQTIDANDGSDDSITQSASDKSTNTARRKVIVRNDNDIQSMTTATGVNILFKQS